MNGLSKHCIFLREDTEEKNYTSEEVERILDVKVLTLDEICKKFNVSREFLDKQMVMGIEVEYEHTTHKEISIQIALAHLMEFPDYYTRLKKMEDDGEAAWN